MSGYSECAANVTDISCKIQVVKATDKCSCDKVDNESKIKILKMYFLNVQGTAGQPLINTKSDSVKNSDLFPKL